MNTDKKIEIKHLDPRAKKIFFVNSLTSFLIAFGVYALLEVWLVGKFDAGERVLLIDVFNTTGRSLFYLLIITAIVYLWAHLKYKYYTYHLDDDAFRKDYGIIHRRSTTIPYDRIQNVDISRTLLERMFGISSLFIQTAGGSAHTLLAEGRLPGLSKEEATDMQSELLVLAKKTRK